MVWTTIRLFIPIQEDEIDTLQTGDRLLANGRVFSMRDKALERICQAIENSEELPFTLENEIIYYNGPTPALEGESKTDDSNQWTTHIDSSMIRIMESLKIRAIIGKGPRSVIFKDSCRNHKNLYLEAFINPGGYLNHFITSKEIVAFEELGADAVYELKITDLPLVIVNDIYGRDLYNIAKNEDSKAFQEMIEFLSGQAPGPTEQRK